MTKISLYYKLFIFIIIFNFLKKLIHNLYYNIFKIRKNIYI